MCSLNSNDELYHYCVLGMKFVTRKGLTRQNASKYKWKGLTISKANQQAAKDNIAAKKQTKIDKKNAKVNMSGKDKLKYTAAKGKKAVATVAMASLADDIYNDGRIKKTGKAVVKAAERAATEAYLYKHGSIEVTWKD